MKKILILSVLICLQFFFISCSDNKAETISSDKNLSKDSTVIAQAETDAANSKSVFKGIESGDLSVMDNFVSPNIVDHAPGGDIKGLDNVKKMLGDIHNHYSNLKFESLAEASGGDYHFSLVRTTGTTKDTAMGMPPNTPIDNITVGVVKIENGKAVEHWMFLDPKEAMKMQKAAMNKSNKKP